MTNVDGGALQADALVGFGTRHKVLVFFQIDDARRFREAAGRLVAQGRLASVREVLTHRREGRVGHTPWINLALSAPGLGKLGVDLADFRCNVAPGHARFPGNLYGKFKRRDAFTQGCAARRQLLGDPGEVDAFSYKDWIVGVGDRRPHGVWLVGARARPTEVVKRLSELPGVCVLRVDWGCRSPDGRGILGFRDGVSNQDIDICVDGQPLSVKPTVPAYDVLLGAPRPAKLGVLPFPAWATWGSFLVYRRLLIDESAFHQAAIDTARRLARHDGTFHPRVKAAWVGRWPDGSSLAKHAERQPEAPDLDDEFDYRDDPQGSCCPRSAHVRKARPRVDTITQGGHTVTHLPRIVRRGTSYVTDDEREGLRDHGSLFLCYQSSIEEQFELIQRHWLNRYDLPEEGGGQDPIAGQAPREAHRRRLLRASVPGHGTVPFALSSFVHPTGGAYLLLPSLTGLATLLTPRS